MARRNLTVCLLGSDGSHNVMTANNLERAGFSVDVAASPEDAFRRAQRGSCRVLLTDCLSIGTNTIEFLDYVSQQDLGIHVILIASGNSVDSAVEAIKHGAHDYLCKPVDYPRLTRILDCLAEELPQNGASTPLDEWRPLPLSEMRRIHIRRVLETCGGNRVRAARMLGIGRTSLYRFLKSADKPASSARAAV